MKHERNGRLQMTWTALLVIAVAWMAGCGPTEGNAEQNDAAQEKVWSATVRLEATAPVAPPPPVVVQATPPVEVQRTPMVVAQAAAREAAKQNGTWTSENIQKNPYLFIQDQIHRCDELKAKIEAQSITMVRLGKQAARSIEEADSMTARYTTFLQQAKAAYKEAEQTGQWPVDINGFKLDQEQLDDRIADALERIELAKKDRAAGEAIVKKAEVRKGVLKTKKQELASLRLQLVQQGEQVKMNAQLAEINDLANVLGVMKDMILEIEEDPTQATLDDLTADDPNAARKRTIREFLDD